MSLRVSLPEVTSTKIGEVIESNLRRILVNSKSVGVRTVDKWQDNLTEDCLQTNRDLAVSDSGNLISFEKLGVHRKMTNLIAEAFPSCKVTPSGFFHYPPTGYMGWHTNSDFPCKRLYITWAAEANKSFFRYVDGSEVITDYDDKGLTFRLFDIKSHPPYLWHCVGSNTDRISIGYRLDDTRT